MKVNGMAIKEIGYHGSSKFVSNWKARMRIFQCSCIRGFEYFNFFPDLTRSSSLRVLCLLEWWRYTWNVMYYTSGIMETKKIDFYFQKSSKLIFDLYFALCRRAEKHLSFVNISPTLVIHTSMERSSRVLQHGNPKIWFFSQKSSKLNFDLCWRSEIALASLISLLH